ncbi:hypothetical protein [Psychromonas sp. Urea-02u-13]|uniref:hypothetical protein n=1 Tax=Psychromonas sp. Urea-02u-13 TaxID=2058326 RepID=UPI001E5BD5C3|nr:hypothetical protein [Psychromonas sp. Urea-02u-13]
MINSHNKGQTLPQTSLDPLFQLIEPNTDFYRCLVTKNWDALPFEKIQPDAQGDYKFKINAHQLNK